MKSAGRHHKKRLLKRDVRTQGAIFKGKNEMKPNIILLLCVFTCYGVAYTCLRPAKA